MVINVPLLTERSGVICENRVRTHLDRVQLSSSCTRRSPGPSAAAPHNGPVSWSQRSAGPLVEASELRQAVESCRQAEQSTSRSPLRTDTALLGGLLKLPQQLLLLLLTCLLVSPGSWRPKTFCPPYADGTSWRTGAASVGYTDHHILLSCFF